LIRVRARTAQRDHDGLIDATIVALYRSNLSRRGGYLLFTPDMTMDAVSRLELVVHYQPVVALDTKQIVEVEALVRWEHPWRGLLGPSEFIPLAEETGLIISLGLWVLETACQHFREWLEGVPETRDLVLSVNLSPRQFEQADLVDQIRRVLHRTDVDPARVKLEITERIVLDESVATVQMIESLADLGIALAIDDFGTGNTGFSTLKHRPIDTLKIDRSFVKDLGVDPEDIAIVRAIVGLAGTLGLTVTAEGIEHAMHVDALRRLGCQQGQGYYFAGPMPAPEFLAWLTSSQRTTATSGARGQQHVVPAGAAPIVSAA
jgi:EAL domain-containing protein (putative c-di-GMP-specific phosphodiesterase class I)